MKNTITLLVAVLLIASGLSSCGTTLVKRQHGSGYYVNKNPRIPTAESERNDHKHIKPGSTKAENATPETDPTSDEQLALVRTSNESENLLAPNDPTNGTSEEMALKPNRSATGASDQVQPAKPSLYEWASNTRLSPKMNFASVDQQSNSVRDSEGGLSLFGLVILILVILWLVAVLSGGWGLGGLIHVLLIVALILLILWLLRVI